MRCYNGTIRPNTCRNRCWSIVENDRSIHRQKQGSRIHTRQGEKKSKGSSIMVLKELQEFIEREKPLLRTETILKGNIEYNEKVIPRLKKLLEKLKSGERPKYVYIEGQLYVFPKIKYIEKEIERREKKLPQLRKWLEEARKKKLIEVV